MLRSRTIWVWTLASAFCGAALPARADVAWSVDPAGSTVTLSAKELIVSKVGGTIPIVSGEVVTAGGLTTPSRVDVVLAAAALTTHDAKRDADLRSDHFFDVARYPQITFDSDRVRTTGPQTFAIDGRLTMHGVTRPITFDARATGVRNDARGKHRVHYDAVGSFRRSDYGMTYARGVVGNVVVLNVTIEAVD
ncbi:MAG TPA: YceI family protein [Dongiaceae bacterium]|nr:YceI family protein [Dongiaceae bacterium]